MSESEALKPKSSTDAPAAVAGGAPVLKAVPKGSRPKHKRMRLSPVAWFFISVAGFAAVGVVLAISQYMMPGVQDGPPLLENPHNDTVNGVSIRAPKNWLLQDPFDGSNVYILGPKEKGFSPLIIMCTEVSSGKLPAYVKEHKDRTNLRGDSVVWLSEEVDIIDSTRAVRLEYEYNYKVEGKEDVKVRGLQYIVGDWPRYYRLSAYVRADLFESYRPRFEASMRSFKRMPKPELPKFEMGGSTPATPAAPESQPGKK
jgi:hypothetical protein